MSTNNTPKPGRVHLNSHKLSVPGSPAMGPKSPKEPAVLLSPVAGRTISPASNRAAKSTKASPSISSPSIPKEWLIPSQPSTYIQNKDNYKTLADFKFIRTLGTC